jgi:hypothetical protein
MTTFNENNHERYSRLTTCLHYEPLYDMFNEIEFSRFTEEQQNIIIKCTEDAIHYLTERRKDL